MICEECQTACFELLDRTLDKNAEREVLAHIDSCPECAVFLKKEKERRKKWPNLLESAASARSKAMPADTVERVLRGRPKSSAEKMLRLRNWLGTSRFKRGVAASIITLAVSLLAVAGVVAVIELTNTSEPENNDTDPNMLVTTPEVDYSATDSDSMSQGVSVVEETSSEQFAEIVIPVEEEKTEQNSEPETPPVEEIKIKEPEMKLASQIAVVTTVATVALSSSGETLFNGSTGSDWNTPANWSSGVVPGSTDSAVIGSTAAAANATAHIGSGGNGTAANVTLGRESGTSGKLTVNGGSLAIMSSAASYVGQSGTGELIVTNNAVLEGGAITIGSVKGSQGTLRILYGGVLRNPSNTIIVATAGTGNLYVDGGTINTPGYGITGASSVGGKANILFDNGASVTSKNFLLPGWGADSSADLILGGGSTVNNIGDLTLGSTVRSVGSVAVESGSWVQKGIVYVGNKKGGTGNIKISGGDFQPQTEVRIGAEAGSSGFLTVTNTTLVWTNANSKVYAGHSGIGTIDVLGSTMSFPTFLYVANASGATGTVHFVDSDVTNRTSIIVGNVAGSAGSIVQSGGNLTVADYFRLPANGTGYYVAENAVFNGKWVTVAAYGSGTAAIGQVDLSGTQRVFRVSSSLTVGTQGTGTITNHVAQYAGGVDLDTSATLTIGDKGNIHIAFEENPAELGMYWGLRWKGDHVTDLTALHETTPAKLSWDVSGIDPYYHADVGIQYDGTYTYVGIPIDRFAMKPTLIVVK